MPDKDVERTKRGTSVGVPLRSARGSGVLQGVAMLLRTLMAIIALACVFPQLSLGDDLDRLIDKALDLSGLEAQLEAVPTVILSAVPDEDFPAATSRSESKELARKLAVGQSVQATVRDAVRAKCGVEEIRQVVGFYGTNLGRKVGRMQKSALSDNTLQGVREGWKIVGSLSPERLALIKRLVRADRVTHRNSRLLRAAIQGLAKGASPSEDEATMKKKVDEVGKAILSLEGTAYNAALVAFAYTLRSLRDNELEEFVTFRESEPALQFGEAVQYGMEEAVRRIARSVGEMRRGSNGDAEKQ